MTPSQSFDDYAESYQVSMSEALGRLGGESAYYLDRKVQILRHAMAGRRVKRILDFGSGIGAAVPFLKESFLPDQLVCTDHSKESLRLLAEKFPDVQTVFDCEIEEESHDLVFVANVLHHVSPSERADLVKTLSRYLAIGGVLAVFEHNPVNPVTRKIVSNCAFDEGVELLHLREVTRYVTAIASLKIIHKGYYLFVPEPLSKVNWIERYLKLVPFGGQHFVLAQRMM